MVYNDNMEKINFKNEEEFMETIKSSKPAHRATLGGGGQSSPKCW